MYIESCILLVTTTVIEGLSLTRHSVTAHFLHTRYTSSTPFRYATGVASVTTLYHLHVCFSLQRSVVAALSSAGVSDKEIGIASQEWWLGRTILLALSMGLQKIPMTILKALIRVELKAQSTEATHGSRRCVPRWFPVVPWVFWGILVTGSFAFTVILTSKGLLGTNELGETGVPCQCRGIAASSNTEADWLLLVCMTVIFKWLIYRPIVLFAAVCLHLRAANKLARKMVANSGSGAGVVVSVPVSSNTGSSGSQRGDGSREEDDGASGGMIVPLSSKLRLRPKLTLEMMEVEIDIADIDEKKDGSLDGSTRTPNETFSIANPLRVRRKTVVL